MNVNVAVGSKKKTPMKRAQFRMIGLGSRFGCSLSSGKTARRLSYPQVSRSFFLSDNLLSSRSPVSVRIGLAMIEKAVLICFSARKVS